MIGIFTRKLFNHNRTVIFLAITIGLIFGYTSLIISSWSLYRLLFVFFILLFLPILFAIVGNVSRTLLVALVFAIPLNFSLAPFAKAPPHPGGAGGGRPAESRGPIASSRLRFPGFGSETGRWAFRTSPLRPSWWWTGTSFRGLPASSGTRRRRPGCR